MIKKISIKDLKYVPSNHEDPKNPGVYKKILFDCKDLPYNARAQMINWAQIPFGKQFKPHFHQDMDEVFIIISGRARIQVGKQRIPLSKGEAIYIPKNVVHTMKNTGKKPVYYLVIGLSRRKGGKTIISNIK